LASCTPFPTLQRGSGQGIHGTSFTCCSARAIWDPAELPISRLGSMERARRSLCSSRVPLLTPVRLSVFLPVLVLPGREAASHHASGGTPAWHQPRHRPEDQPHHSAVGVQQGQQDPAVQGEPWGGPGGDEHPGCQGRHGCQGGRHQREGLVQRLWLGVQCSPLTGLRTQVHVGASAWTFLGTLKLLSHCGHRARGLRHLPSLSGSLCHRDRD